MIALAEASLSEDERRALDGIVLGLREGFGSRLRSVWLYGSRARGEKPHPESDVDLLVVLDRRTWEDDKRVHRIAWSSAEAANVSHVSLSTIVYDIARITQRREIESFFLQEVDRDKIVLFGEA